MKKFLLCWAAWLFAAAAAPRPVSGESDFVTTVGTRFYLSGKPYYYVGANMWYAPLLASEGRDGDRRRLCAELDSLHAVGADNLRFHLHFRREADDSLSASLPALWREDGTPNDTLLRGLDYLIAELGRRGMKATVCLAATAQWSKGTDFYDDEEEVARHVERVRFVVSRVNALTRRSYKDDPAIMAWEIGDRPQPDKGTADLAAFRKFVLRVAASIKRADCNHLVAMESCGLKGCDGKESVYEQMHGDPSIDYATLQFRPWEWDWVDRSRVAEDLPYAYLQARSYLDEHCRMARGMDKPLVLEAFGYPRDRFFFSHEQSTFCRNDFFSFVLAQVARSAKEQDVLAGAAFWNWAGEGRSETLEWEPGRYVGDTPDRPQGLYAVFDCDSTTLRLIRETAEQLRDTR